MVVSLGRKGSEGDLSAFLARENIGD